ncbi:hypothetical protein RMATCC62417_18596 [Rhizopus microsporus]|nr:hypothetical protein RMATCC62417_18596 [Rhizopus microsporus]
MPSSKSLHVLNTSTPFVLTLFDLTRLELMEFHSYVFSKEVDITEADVVVKIWSPILERLFRRTVLRTKWCVRIHLFGPKYACYNKLLWGESMGNSGDVSNSPGFKFDLRVIKDTLLMKKKEADKANCEISRIDPGLVKITSDGTKLLIQSKTVLDKLLEEDPEKAKEISVPVPQLVVRLALALKIRKLVP